jgi:putative mRNA 3-end processing factor
MLRVTDHGLYCEAGGFHIDPWGPANRALITHAHSDHARAGSERYLCADACAPLLRERLPASPIESVPYGKAVSLDGVRVSFHPAGHVLGSAQIRVEHKGEVWTVSGDYKIEADPTCAPFEPVRCDVFVTESTFGLPVYRWTPQEEVFAEILSWWRANQEKGKATVLFGYALGKAQRLLAGLDPSIGPIYAHGAVHHLNELYRAAGVRLPPCGHATEESRDWSRALILAPPSANGSPWMRRFGRVSTGFASGWMRIRGPRRRRAVDRGFVLSDHADWPGLLSAIRASGAGQVLVTHGYRQVMVRWLESQGLRADSLETRFEGEHDEEPAEPAS